ncbi:MAG TPA: phosphatidylserine decarboxylase [Anaerolineae bacterium]|nr:phosphatidylserine decarboxylase [Anaerolineae bacterium]
MTPTHHSVSPIIPPEHHISALEQASGVMSLLAGAGVVGTIGWLLRRKAAWLALAGASFSALAGVLWIFRNPARSTAGGPSLAVAPCDGQVGSIALIHEPRFLKAPAYKVIIRVRPGDVQVTRAPVEGIVHYRRYEPRGQAGATDDALWIGIRQPEGAKVLLKLSASPFWRAMPAFVGRRITLLPDLEDRVQQGQVTGHLPLGGEVQVYIPVNAQVTVEPGERLRAGESVLARL